MPVKEGPVPPFPEGADPDEYDRLRRRVLWKMPSGLYVVGSTDKGERRNGMTLNWATQISFDPKWIGIGVEQAAFTHELIAASGVFSLCIVDREDRAIVRKFTKPVEVDLAAKTLNGFPYLDGAATGAPVLAQSVAYVECEVRQTVEVGDHTLAGLICFEIAFDAETRESVLDGAQLMAVGTNNATFDTNEAQQQLAMVQLRSIEHGRDGLMASTVGVSGFTDHTGEVSQATEFNTAAVIQSDLTLSDHSTPASTVGILPEAVLTGAALVALACAILINLKHRRSQT